MTDLLQYFGLSPFHAWMLAAFVLPSLYGTLYTLVSVENPEFDDSPGLDTESIYVATQCAVDAYRGKDDKTEKMWRERIRMAYGESVEFHQSSGVEAFSYIDSQVGCGFLAIRGTSGAFDLLRDIMSWKVKSDIGGTVHAGFDGDASYLFSDWGRRAYADESIEWVVCGHSLGAGTAIEVSARIEASDLTLRGCVALCAPRSGDKKHACRVTNMLGNRLVRVTFSRDLVCMVPLRLMGYAHAGKTHYFDRLGDYHPYLTTNYRLYDLFVSTICDVFKPGVNWLGYHSGSTVRDLVRGEIDRFSG